MLQLMEGHSIVLNETIIENFSYSSPTSIKGLMRGGAAQIINCDISAFTFFQGDGQKIHARE